MSSMRPHHRSDPTPDCDAIQELVPDYVFGFADPVEIRLVESNLAQCPEAIEQLADFRRLQQEMRIGVPQIEPSAELGERLMAALGAEADTARAPARPIPFRRPIHRAWLAAAVILVVLAMSNLYWLLRVNNLTQQNSQLAAQVEGQGGTFVLASTSELRWVRLPPSQQNDSAAAFMMWNGPSKIGILYAHALPKLEPGKTYQLWLTRGQEFVSAGTISIDADGNGALLFHINEPIDKYTWARITSEPQNGSNEPSNSVVVVGKLST